MFFDNPKNQERLRQHHRVGQTGYVYDFENQVISAKGITYVYDGDGHRVSKTVNGVTTSYATM